MFVKLLQVLVQVQVQVIVLLAIPVKERESPATCGWHWCDWWLWTGTWEHVLVPSTSTLKKILCVALHEVLKVSIAFAPAEKVIRGRTHLQFPVLPDETFYE